MLNHNLLKDFQPQQAFSKGTFMKSRSKKPQSKTPAPAKKATPLSLADRLWKEVIEHLFEDFCHFFLADLAKDVDFKKGFEFLDQEFSKIELKSVEKKRCVDKLVKVFLKSGKEQWVLIHIEVQGYYDKDFEERMFIYYYRIFDTFKKDIVSLAIFTEGKKKFKPSCYQKEFYQTKLEYQYRTYKVLDQQEEKLLKHSNPFALAILAAKYSLRAKNKDSEKVQFKLQLIRLLIKKKSSREKIQALFRFIDGALQIRDLAQEQLFFEQIKQFSGEKTMEFMTNFEHASFVRGEKKGEKKDEKKGKKEVYKEAIQDLLEVKFPQHGLLLMDKIKNLRSLEKLQNIKAVLKAAKTLDEVQQVLS